MSKIKIKTEEIGDLIVARSKLDGVLQTLVDQKEDGTTPEKETTLKIENDPDIYFDSPINTSTKKSPRSSTKFYRKRRLMKEDSFTMFSPNNSNQNPHTMKLFDRMVDLSQFTEETPLYPICRAWVQDQLPKQTCEQNNNSDDKDEFEDELLELIYELPGPVNIKMENDRNLLIPSPLAQNDPPLDIHLDESLAPFPETLFINHMDRWKTIRQKWKEASRLNQSRYIESYKILREMYDRQNIDI